MSFIVKSLYKLCGKPAPYYARHPLWLLAWKPWRKLLNVVVIPSIPFNCLRVWLYRLVGYRIGRRVFIGMKCYLDDVEPSKTVIEDDVIISYGCYFAAHGRNQGHTDILVAEGAYLGMCTKVVSGRTGVSIGRHCTIGAGALVTKSIPDGCTAVGVPARVVRAADDSLHTGPESQCNTDW